MLTLIGADTTTRSSFDELHPALGVYLLSDDRRLLLEPGVVCCTVRSINIHLP